MEPVYVYDEQLCCAPKFTGKERDSESGLDMFGARYYGSSLGRFMTPDWAAKPTNVPYASFGNPQSLNLYSYVNNNPTTTRDPDGHCAEDACVIEGSAALLYVGGAALVAGTAAVLNTPAGQRSLSTFTSAASQSISDTVHAIGNFFHPDNSGKATSPPGTTTTNVATGTPASTSQQGAVDTSPKSLIVVSPGGDGGWPSFVPLPASPNWLPQASFLFEAWEPRTPHQETFLTRISARRGFISTGPASS